MFDIALIIPARYNSTRLPGKPLIELNGKTMLMRVYQNAMQVQGVNQVFVATDDENIKSYCHTNNISCLMTSLNHETLLSRIAECSDLVAADYYLVVNGDEPLLDSKDIEALIENLPQVSTTPMLRNLVTRIKSVAQLNDPSNLKVAMNQHGEGIYISRSVIPFTKNGSGHLYYKHLGGYLLNQAALSFFIHQERGLLESIEDIDLLRFIENKQSIQFILVDSDAISVDTQDDVKIVSEVLAHAER